MKKTHGIAAAMALIALFASCTGKKTESAPLPTSPSAHATESPAPVIDSSYAGDIDQLLVEYETIVDQYLADMSASADTAADETSLGEVSTKLSDLAKDFSVDQLAKYNAITAKLSGE